jgi:hypothetical protein
LVQSPRSPSHSFLSEGDFRGHNTDFVLTPKVA